MMELGESEGLAIFFCQSKKVTKCSDIGEDRAGEVSRLNSEEKMLWSLQGYCAKVSSFSLYNLVSKNVGALCKKQIKNRNYIFANHFN